MLAIYKNSSMWEGIEELKEEKKSPKSSHLKQQIIYSRPLL